MTPLLIKVTISFPTNHPSSAHLNLQAIINFSEDRSSAQANGEPVPNIGRGVGMAIGLLILVIMSSVFQHQFFWRSMMTGALVRATLITSVYNRGVVLTPKSRTSFPNSRLLNYISSDISRVEHAAQWFVSKIILLCTCLVGFALIQAISSPSMPVCGSHTSALPSAVTDWLHIAAWTAPIQTIVCLIILLVQLGPSALAGFALFIAIIPLQEQIMSAQFKMRKDSVQWTDKRSAQLLLPFIELFSH